MTKYVLLLLVAASTARSGPELRISVDYSKYANQARSLLPCFRVAAVVGDNQLIRSQDPVADNGHAAIAVEPAKVRQLQWARDCRNYFVLWPPTLNAPVQNPCREFMLKKLQDVHDLGLERLRVAIARGRFNEADLEYRDLADVYEECDGLPPENNIDSRFLRFSCLREMCNCAKAYSRSVEFRQNRDKLIDEWQRWVRALVSTAASGGTDDHALARTMDALKIWNEFALQAYCEGRLSWGDRTIESRNVCRNDDCKARLIGDVITALSVLYDRATADTIRPKIAEALKSQMPQSRREQLARYEQLATSSSDSINLGHLEQLLDGLSALYPQSLTVVRSSN